MPTLGPVDPDRDHNRSNQDVHYRLYLAKSGPKVICVQDFDYPDYDPARFLSYEGYDDEHHANLALDTLLAAGVLLDDHNHLRAPRPT